MQTKVYLASKCPRRQALLQLMEVDFELLIFDVPEDVLENEEPSQYSHRVTHEKMTAGWSIMIQEQRALRPVLSADTEVVHDRRILGKPKDYDDAFAMLKSYSNAQHEVITSVGLKYHHSEKIITTKTTVYFESIPDACIHHYLASGDYVGKAGAYGIQSYMGQFITGISGCFYAVMGLPLNTVRALLLDFENTTIGDTA